jgi:hypothetical protein
LITFKVRVLFESGMTMAKIPELTNELGSGEFGMRLAPGA